MGDTALLWTALFLIGNVGIPMLLCYVIARKANRSAWWALAGLAHVFGIIAVSMLPYHRGAEWERAHPRTARAPRLQLGLLGDLIALVMAGWVVIGPLLFLFGLYSLFIRGDPIIVRGVPTQAVWQKLRFLCYALFFTAAGAAYFRFLRPLVGGKRWPPPRAKRRTKQEPPEDKS